MRCVFAVLAVVVLGAGCARHGDPRLSGTFVSDRAATLAYLRSTGQYAPRRLEKLGPMLGNLEVTYRGNTATMVVGGRRETKKFNVAESGPDHVVIETEFGTEEALGKVVTVPHRLEFTPDGYWATTPMMKAPFKEKFTRRDESGDLPGATTEPASPE